MHDLENGRLSTGAHFFGADENEELLAEAHKSHDVTQPETPTVIGKKRKVS